MEGREAGQEGRREAGTGREGRKGRRQASVPLTLRSSSVKKKKTKIEKERTGASHLLSTMRGRAISRLPTKIKLIGSLFPQFYRTTRKEA